ncbi:hypothetical protein E1Z16_15695 [Listeria monocytogenes]|uniref:ORF10 n=6 Tax=Bacillota TaxID=1239 RepID=Q9AGN3_CLOPF|nr:ORF10 [Clostridium perfringens]ADK98555.1 hypothetical protein [Enterococcus faecium]AUU55611.1 hypothetical protein RK83_004915 [Staphylococcus aureus]AYQ25547.1 hypothetical protein AUF16_13665 [Enterococcus avium]EAC3083137.1 hypothetical protein [Listeria monocytogenes]ECC1683047.1 hypothetical protein [Listeria innocua]EGO8854267.1 hypothetical protein [Enterococcus faecalis]EGQ1608398.1 hypothetical protein [Staphylococcus pseudintermedius]MDB0429514.1 hypothetical protein [Clostri
MRKIICHLVLLIKFLSKKLIHLYWIDMTINVVLQIT